MRAELFNGVNMIPGENQAEYEGLPIKAEIIDGVPYLTSIWRPTPEELKLLNEGGVVNLTVLAVQQPPVSLFVQSEDGSYVPDRD